MRAAHAPPRPPHASTFRTFWGRAFSREIDRAAVAQRVGSDAFAGGWLDPRAGGIQPLSYARGLARAALERGARVHGHTLVNALQRENGRWTLRTAQGPVVRAERVLIATNGYTGGLWPGLEQTVLAANSFIVATEPIDNAAMHKILPGGETASNTSGCCCTSAATRGAAC
jgi:glycine/D-amino acid oxidase-like deaminating enzyme